MASDETRTPPVRIKPPKSRAAEQPARPVVKPQPAKNLAPAKATTPEAPNTPAPKPQERPAPAPRPKPAPNPAPKPAPKPVPKPAPKAEPKPVSRYPGQWSVQVGGWERPYRPGNQSTIDRCEATLWRGPHAGGSAPHDGVTWLAGHDYCGFHRWASAPVGAQVVLTTPSGERLQYKVVEKWYLDRQGGAEPAGLLRHDLMLQTCKGRGTMFTYARRIH